MYKITLLFLSMLILSPIMVEAEVSVPAWEDSSCSFKKDKTKTSPSELVKEFIDRDSKGQFLKGNSWFDASILCPGHLGGPDKIKVFSNFNIVDSKITDNDATFDVRFEILGQIGSGGPDGNLNSYTAEPRTEDIHFELVKTPFGWRVKDYGGPAPRVSSRFAVESAPHKNWISADLAKLKDAALVKNKK